MAEKPYRMVGGKGTVFDCVRAGKALPQRRKAPCEREMRNVKYKNIKYKKETQIY